MTAYHPAVQWSASSGAVLGVSYRVPDFKELAAGETDSYNNKW